MSLTPQVSNPHGPRRRGAAFFDQLLGPRPDADANTWPRAGDSEGADSRGDPSSWVDSFNAALTEAASIFILRHVDPYHREDPTTGYAVRRVKIGFKDAAAPCLRAIQSMPASMRDRIVLLRIKKAKGVEQLLLDNFYGLSIIPEETLMDGQLVETMVSYSGARFALTFEFKGQYVTLPTAPTTETAKLPGGEVEESTCASIQIERSATAQAGQIDTLTNSETTNQPDALLLLPPSRETPLARSRPAVTSRPGRETPLYRPVAPLRSPVARLHLAARGAHTVVELFEDGFPYTLGRHPEAAGFAVRPRSGAPLGSASAGLLAHTQTPDTLCFVSRDHLVLHMPDLVSGDIRVDNLSAQRAKNGTFVNGAVQPQRFIHPLGTQNPLCLGGTEGDGILEVRLERA